MPYKNLILTPSQYTEQHKVQTSQFYKGFSTVDNTNRSCNVYDFDIVKQDLLNHFNTRLGERVMNPEFGSVIWNLLYEPFTDNIRTTIEADIKKIVGADPRIKNPVIKIVEAEYGILLEVTLNYTGTNQSETMRLAFDKDAGLLVQ